MKNILKYLYFKYNKNQTKVYQALKNKESVNIEDIEHMRTSVCFDDYITIIDNNYPKELTKIPNPPIVIHKNTKIIKGVLIDVHNNEIKPHIHYYTDDDSTESLYKIYDMLKCTCIDVQVRKIGNKFFDLYIDDEGLWKEDNPPSIITTNKNDNVIETIVGNTFICNHDDEGGMESLTNEDISMISNEVVRIGNRECIRAYVK